MMGTFDHNIALRLASMRTLGYKKNMSVTQELLDILACPVCIKSVHLTADEKGLQCEQCKRIYPIVDDIPVMLIEEATIEGRAEDK
jgi:uncharacterized protein YbaR (Trm112 family)